MLITFVCVYIDSVDFFFFFFFFNDTATTEIYTLSLHDALPICGDALNLLPDRLAVLQLQRGSGTGPTPDRKSTRLNSSHQIISYAVFCLKKTKGRGLESKVARQNLSTFAKPLVFFFNDTATTEIYTLSLHDALPNWIRNRPHS